MPPPPPGTALIAGASGLVGGHLVRLLLQEEHYARVIAIGRREVPGLRHPKLEQRVVDFDALEPAAAALPPVRDVFCCLGTTIKHAGSRAAFRRVDHDYVVAVARLGLAAGAAQFLIVSAVDADPASRMFYSRVKGETEAVVCVGRWRRYRPVPARAVAQAMARIAREAPRGPNVFEYDGITAAA